jgi:hypothetical protein
MIEPSAGWICETRTPAGIADSEISLTAEVDMGSDLPLRPCCFEPSRDFASFWHGEQVWRPGLKSRARLRFLVDFWYQCVSCGAIARNSNSGVNCFKRLSGRIAARLTPV